MNQQISRLAVASLVLVISLIVGTTYWQAWAAPSLADRRDNAIKVVGYSTQARSRSGIEQFRNDYLTGANANLATLLDTTLDRLVGATIEGNDVILTLRPVP